MPRRKFLIVKFADESHAKAAYNYFRSQNPSLMSAATDFSRVERSTVYIQEGSYSIPHCIAKSILLECEGAIPVSV